MIPTLNNIDTGLPLASASWDEFLADYRQTKEILKGVLLKSHEPTGLLVAGSVNGVAGESIGSLHLADGAVITSKLGDFSVTTLKLANASVSSDKLIDGSVTGSKIATGALQTQHFNTNTIPISALNGLITSNYLSSHATVDSNRAVGALHLKDGAVTDRAVTSVSFTKLIGGVDNSILFKIGGSWVAAPLQGALSFDVPSQSFIITNDAMAAVFGHVVSIGSSGGAGTSGGWTTRVLTEIDDPEDLMSFSSGSFSLDVGNYLINIKAGAYGVGRHQARLIASGTSPIVYGTTAIAGSGNLTYSEISMLLEVADDTEVFTLEHWVQTSVSSDDFGPPSSLTPDPGQNDYFAIGHLIKISA